MDYKKIGKEVYTGVYSKSDSDGNLIITPEEARRSLDNAIVEHFNLQQGY